MYSHLFKYKVLTPPPFRLAGCNKFKPIPLVNSVSSSLSFLVQHISFINKKDTLLFPALFQSSLSQTIHHPNTIPSIVTVKTNPPPTLPSLTLSSSSLKYSATPFTTPYSAVALVPFMSSALQRTRTRVR